MMRVSKYRLVGAAVVVGGLCVGVSGVMAQDKAAPKPAAPVKAPPAPAAAVKAPPAPAAPKPDAAAAGRARASNENFKKQADQWAEKAGKASGAAKDSADNAVLAIKSTIAAYEALAKAYEGGVQADIKAANEAAVKVNAASTRAIDKASCLERAATHLAPLSEGLIKNTPDAAKPALDALTAAHKAAADAWGKVAAAITPEADANVIEGLRDAATGATNETQVASRALTAATAMVNLKAAAERTGNPDAAKKIEEIKKQDDAILAVVRQQNELALKLRKMDRDRNAASVEFNKINQPAPKTK